MTKKKEVRQAWRAARKAAGCCNSCSKPALPGTARCAECAERYRVHSANQLKRRQEAGLCSVCKSVPEPGKRRCAKCVANNKKSARKSKTGVTAEDFERQLTEQEGLCAICSRALREGRGGMAADHCHKTGAFRGVLCNPCNRGIGYLGDSLNTLASAFSYLLSPPVQRRLYT